MSINSWIVKKSQGITVTKFNSTISKKYITTSIQTGDILIFSDNDRIVSFASIFRIRENFNESIYYFDGYLDSKKPVELSEYGVAHKEDDAILRIEFKTYEKLLEASCMITNNNFPFFSGEKSDEQSHIRNLLRFAVIDDLLGPANGPEEEIIEMSVRDRYLVGKLAPIVDGGSHKVDCPFSKDDLEDKTTTDDLVKMENGDHVSFDKNSQFVDYVDDEEKDIDAAEGQFLVPSSIGFTFCVDAISPSVFVSASWGHYERANSDKINEKKGRPFRCWKRIPCGGSMELALNEGKINSFSIDEDCPSVQIQGTIRKSREDNTKLVTLFLVNTAEKPKQNQDAAWVFQPEICVTGKNGEAIFRRRPISQSIETDEELLSLEMMYRKRLEFAVGHGISVHAKVSNANSELAVEIRTTIIPEYEVPYTEASVFSAEERPGLAKMVSDGFFDMKNLAALEVDVLTSGLTLLADDYAAWIEKEKIKIGNTVKGYDSQTLGVIKQCSDILKRIKEGISVLVSDKNALSAFRFANKAMALQRIHSIYTKNVQSGIDVSFESIDKRENRSWRPFQLAFILITIPSLANPTHEDRTKPLDAIADLLWFPTGGGKTEAYLGVAAFAMAIRRLQESLGGLDSSRGLAVIMRYTLRLLTIQQFQRASILLCAMEHIRKSTTGIWGDTPFTLGLWVGQKVTPNTTSDSSAAIETEREKKYRTGSSPAQLTYCPWCGKEIKAERDIVVDKELGRTYIYCSDTYGNCEFSRVKSEGSGLPVLVVDEEIYHYPPSMLIATVDKFAMMAWRNEARTLFGKASRECPRHGLLWPESPCSGTHTKTRNHPAVQSKSILHIRPPDLIIQDEFHLISGPLGTMVALYETAIDKLSSWAFEGKIIKPKVIASTATVRKAEEQVNNVFLRKVAVFPPHGIDAEDNFFSIQRSVEEKFGRQYLGICSPGASRPAVLIRVYVALLTGAQAIAEHFDTAADPYMTLIGYFNSLRELGGMRRLAEDDIQTRSYRVEMSDVVRPGLRQRSVRRIDELTSRVSSKDIPQKLKALEAIYKREYAKDDLKALDIVLATNMLSVGVDIDRLGLMVVNGQPKNTAEYIQATSRIGRKFPGLVVTVLTWARPRDLSHYETFEHYHGSFYKHVEALSVTPFSPRALDRGLTGVMTSLLRLEKEQFNPNLGAGKMDSPTNMDAEQVTHVMTERAWKVTDRKAVNEHTRMMCKERIDQWTRAAQRPGRKLGYERVSRQGDVVNLLEKPGKKAWTMFTVPMSMREVEGTVLLILDDSIHSESPPWEYQKPSSPEVNNE